MANPYKIDTNDITPEMVATMLEGKRVVVAEDAGVPTSTVPYANTPKGKEKQLELTRREKARKLDAADAKKGRRQGYKVDSQGRPSKTGATQEIDTSYEPTDAEREEAQNSSQKHEGDLVELKLRTTKKKFVGQNLGKKSQKPPTAGTLPVGKEAEGVRTLAKKNKKVGEHGDMANMVAAHENKEYHSFKDFLS
tara:strand:+ start:366 stop:947 length:582 start_codon:yes stop_codon:yes gene_type:complete